MILKGTIWQILSHVLGTQLKDRQIATMNHVSHNTVKRYRRLATREGLTLERLNELTESELDQMFNKSLHRLPRKREPDVVRDYSELQNPGVTRALLHLEYVEQEPETALGLSQYKLKLQKYGEKLKVRLRKARIPGESTEIDYAGKKRTSKLSWTDIKTGEVHDVDLFVSCSGAAGKIFAFASNDQKQSALIDELNAMAAYYGGLTRNIICDNMKTAVIKARTSDSDAVINRTLMEWARHHVTVIIPTGPYEPTHKGLVEGSVLIAKRWIIARLRKYKFFSIGEINSMIIKLLDEINNRKFKWEPGTRNSKFEELDRPLLIPLPERPFEYAEWQSKIKVDQSYHVRVLGHFYSAPYSLVGEYVEPRVSANSVELYHLGKRVAVHPRSFAAGCFTVCEGHMPPNHRAFAQLTPERISRWADSVGLNTATVVKTLCEDGRSAHAIASRGNRLRRLEKTYGKERLEAACAKALKIQSPTVSTIKSLLQHQMYDVELRAARAQFRLPLHPNIRGAGYYQSPEK